jgi:hypothetical protein
MIIVRIEFDHDGEKYSFSEEQTLALKSMIQIDIISKIMMYIEDLFTILIAMKDFNADYYRLLDENLESNYDNKDLGDRISQFIKDETKFSSEDSRRILSYIEVDKTNFDEFKKDCKEAYRVKYH